jgi:PAS domain S-box-containing protein
MAEFQLQNSFDGAATGVTVFDREGRFLSANDRYSQITGYSRDELLTLDAYRITHPEDVALTQRLAAQLLAGELRTVVMETRYIRKDGDVRWVRNSATLGPHDSAGRATVMVITEDIHGCRNARQLTAACLDEQEAGRGRIARELHDGAAQLLSALSMQLALVGNPGPSVDPSRLIDESIDLTAQCTREIRALIYLLQPGRIAELGLGPGLRAFAAGFSQRSGIAIDARVGELPQVSARAESILFRVMQEWFFKLRRGARRDALVITARPHDGGAQLDLLDPSDLTGADLPEVRSRVQWIGGRSGVETGPGGTRLTVWAPPA